MSFCKQKNLPILQAAAGWQAYKLPVSAPQTACPPSPFFARGGGGRRGPRGVGVCHSSQGGNPWSCSQSHGLGRLRGCTHPLWQGASTFLPLLQLLGLDVGRVLSGPPRSGCGPLSGAALSPGSLPRTEVGRVGRLPSRWEEKLLQLSRLLLSPRARVECQLAGVI